MLADSEERMNAIIQRGVRDDVLAQLRQENARLRLVLTRLANAADAVSLAWDAEVTKARMDRQVTKLDEAVGAARRVLEGL